MLKNTNTGIAFQISSRFSSSCGLDFLSQYERCSCQFSSLQLQLLGSYVRVIKGPQEWKMRFSLWLHNSLNGIGNVIEASSAHSPCPSPLPLKAKKKKKGKAKKFTLEGKRNVIKNIAGLKFRMPQHFSKESCK